MRATRLRSGWLGLGEGPITAKFSRIPLETVGFSWKLRRSLDVFCVGMYKPVFADLFNRPHNGAVWT